MMRRRTLLKGLSAGTAALAAPGLALSQTKPLKIGQLTDYTGIYRDTNGPGEEHAIQMAIEDFNGGKVLGRPIQLLTADNLNKADVATDIMKRWLDVEKIDMLIPSGSSVAALAAHGMAREKGIVTNVTAPAAANFTEQDCSPYGFHWQLDTYAWSRAAVLASGDHAKKSWFFLSVDNVFGQGGVQVCSSTVQELGGKVIGNVKFPMGTTDFASFLAQAQASKADVVGISCAGSDLVRALKQTKEFGVSAAGQLVVAPILQMMDVISAGLDATQGLRFGDSFYWDETDATRAFAKRFKARMGREPGSSYALVYAAVTHYLQAVQSTGSTEGRVVAERMRSSPITTPFWKNTSIRPNGRVIYDVPTMQVKAPSRSTGKFDVVDVVGRTDGEKAFKPLAQTLCKLA